MEIFRNHGAMKGGIWWDLVTFRIKTLFNK
jgi:hypothetical protein